MYIFEQDPQLTLHTSEFLFESILVLLFFIRFSNYSDVLWSMLHCVWSFYNLKDFRRSYILWYCYFPKLLYWFFFSRLSYNYLSCNTPFCFFFLVIKKKLHFSHTCWKIKCLVLHLNSSWNYYYYYHPLGTVNHVKYTIRNVLH